MVALVTMPVTTSRTLKKEISPGELSQRVAVIKRFKELLKAQRDRFRSYLDVLDRQKDMIANGTADDLIQHVELEEKIVSDIFSIQKVIDPLEEMYHSIKHEGPIESVFKFNRQKPDEKLSSGDDEVTGLKEALDSLKAQAVIRSQQNRELLSRRMAELRSEIKSLRSNAYARGRSGFAGAPSPSHIDIKG